MDLNQVLLNKLREARAEVDRLTKLCIVAGIPCEEGKPWTLPGSRYCAMHGGGNPRAKRDGHESCYRPCVLCELLQEQLKTTIESHAQSLNQWETFSKLCDLPCD